MLSSFLHRLLLFFLYIRFIPAFERNLQKLTNNNGRRIKGDRRFLVKAAKVFSFNRYQRAFFRFAVNLLKNEREFKLKVYPSLGLSLAIPLIFIVRIINVSNWKDMLSYKWCFIIYSCATLIPTILINMKYSSNYKGAWVYKTCPIKDLTDIYKGTMKAMLYKIFLPAYCIEFIIFLILYGQKAFSILIAALFNSILFTIICYKVIKPALPFSESHGIAQGEDLIILPLFFILFALGGLHYLCTLMWFGVYLDIGAVMIAIGILWKKTFSQERIKVDWV